VRIGEEIHPLKKTSSSLGFPLEVLLPLRKETKVRENPRS